MNLKSVAAGLIAGATGAAIWAAVGFYLEAEVGWIAWGIGFLVGVAVQIGAGENAGFSTGALAVVIALGSVTIGKYATVHMAVDRFVQTEAGQLEYDFTDNDMIVHRADEIVTQRQAAGEVVEFPDGFDIDNAFEEAHYPADIWGEAKAAWEALPAEEQEALKQESRDAANANIDAEMGNIRQAAFQASFSLFDLLWFGLAAVTAFRVGAGATES